MLFVGWKGCGNCWFESGKMGLFYIHEISLSWT